MKKLLKLIFIVLPLLFSGSILVFASPLVPNNETTEDAIVLATVNIEDAKIVSQEGNIFNISFSLTNREGLQTGVKYGVKLLKNGSFIADEKIYDESLTLNPNSKIFKEIVYTAPSSLSGEYSLVISSNNTSGFPFAIVTVSKVNLSAVSPGIQIFPETCYVQVVEEKNNPKYNLVQGVDIKPEENLKLTCTALNSSETEKSFLVSFETKYRSSYGDVVDQTNVTKTGIILNHKEEKTFSVILPKATTPQAYNVDLLLYSGTVKSNPISVHYVLRGASATIQNVSLDKDYYKKGDEAKVSFIYTPSADSFDGSRYGKTELSSVYFVSKILDGNGNSCAKEQEKDLTNETSIKIDSIIKIKYSCFDPVITITLKDGSGAFLDQKEFKVKTTSVEKNASNMIYVGLLVLILSIIVIFIYIKRKSSFLKNKNELLSNGSDNIIRIMFPFILIVTFLGFIPSNKVSADTVYAGNRYAVVNINKLSFSPGETLVASGSIIGASCNNYATAGRIDAFVNGKAGVIVDINTSGTSVLPYDADGKFNVGYIGGVYSAHFYVKIFTGFTGTASYVTASHDIDYTVTAPPAPTVDVTVTKNTLNLDEYTIVKWTSTNATSCECKRRSNGASCGSGIMNSTGTTYRGSEVSPTETFDVTCRNN